jgi:DNA replication ATP-dependent helicase Dna2
VHAVRALVASGASVLVTSYTNSALDNILLKLVGAGLHDFLRLGRQGSCHPALHEYMPGGARCAAAAAAACRMLFVLCDCLVAVLLCLRHAFAVVPVAARLK